MNRKTGGLLFCPELDSVARGNALSPPLRPPFTINSSLALQEKPRLIARYTRPQMGRIWSDENKYRMWLTVELAATQTLAENGIVPKAAAEKLLQRSDFELDRIREIEADVKHDVIAFTPAVAEKVGDA